MDLTAYDKTEHEKSMVYSVVLYCRPCIAKTQRKAASVCLALAAFRKCRLHGTQPEQHVQPCTQLKTQGPDHANP